MKNGLMKKSKMKRPLKNKRPFGPVIELSETASEQQKSPPFEDEGTSVEETGEDAILEQAERWYEQINKEKNKRKMMKNYFKSMTDLTESEIDDKLDRAGL